MEHESINCEGIEDGDEIIGERESHEMIRKLTAYEKHVREHLNSQVKVFSARDYSQEFLESLIPGGIGPRIVIKTPDYIIQDRPNSFGTWSRRHK